MDARFPIGRFDPAVAVTEANRRDLIGEIAAAPQLLRSAVAGLDDRQLDTRYREGGWTVRQVIHHVADSHINSYVRCRLAITESRPKVTNYDEVAWAELDDARSGPVELSLTLIEALHSRWTLLLESLTSDQWERTLLHPERGELSLNALLALYAWHGRHHAAHVTSLRERSGWS